MWGTQEMVVIAIVIGVLIIALKGPEMYKKWREALKTTQKDTAAIFSEKK
jgi:Sec-independent protein translocase protein TatA